MMLKELLLPAVSLVLLGAALEDMARLRISNFFPMLVVALFAAWVFAAGWENDIWQNGTVFIAVFAVGCVMFGLRWMGGGDVKLMAATALWFDWAEAVSWLVYVTVGGGLLALVIIAGRRMVPSSVREKSSAAIFAAKGPIPYGVAIALGTVMALYMAGPNPSGQVYLPTFVKSLR